MARDNAERPCHPYWYRMWILQEIAKGSVVHMVVGGWWLSWKYFSVMMELVEREPGANIKCQEAFYQNLPLGVFTLGSSQIASIYNLRSRVHDDPCQEYSLTDCLALSSNSQATNPKDKIYALSNLLGPSVNTPKVDYSDAYSTSSLYTDTAAALIGEDPFMTLFLAGRNITLQDGAQNGEVANGLPLPSWVPDFSRCTAADYELLELSRTHYHASRNHPGGLSSPPITVIGSTFLHMLVTPLSTIDRISPEAVDLGNQMLLARLQTIPAVYHAAAQILPQNTGLYPHCAPPQTTPDTASQDLWRLLLPGSPPAVPQTWNEALWRTLLADMAPDRNQYNSQSAIPTPGTYNVTTSPIACPAPPEFDTYLQVALEQFSDLTTTDGIVTSKPLSPRLQQLLRALPPAKRHLTYIGLHLTAAIKTANWKRRFAVSDKMQTMLVPEWAKEGDIVGVVRQISMPVVLRRDSRNNSDGLESWRLVGCCYVHGIMDGVYVEGKVPTEERTFIVV